MRYQNIIEILSEQFFYFSKENCSRFCDIRFLNPAKILPRLSFIPFCFITLYYPLDRWLRSCKCQKFTSVYVLFFSFWQDRGKQSIKEISHPIIANIFPWSFWNILSAGNIWDRSGTENFLGVWDSLKVREFCKFQLVTETRAASEYCSLSDLGPGDRVFQNCCKRQNMKQAICIQLLLLSFTGCESPVLSLRGFGYERPTWSKSKLSLRRFRLSSPD